MMYFARKIVGTAGIIVFVALITFSFAGFSSAEVVPPLDQAGLEKLLEENKGKVVLVDFWATWCPPCRWEIPEFVKFHETYADEGLVVLGVSVDYTEEDVAEFIKNNDVTYPNFMGSEDLKQAHRVFTIPTTIIFGRDGNVAARHMGYAKPQVFEKEIKRELAKPQ